MPDLSTQSPRTYVLHIGACKWIVLPSISPFWVILRAPIMVTVLREELISFVKNRREWLLEGRRVYMCQAAQYGGNTSLQPSRFARTYRARVHYHSMLQLTTCSHKRNTGTTINDALRKLTVVDHTHYCKTRAILFRYYHRPRRGAGYSTKLKTPRAGEGGGGGTNLLLDSVILPLTTHLFGGGQSSCYGCQRMNAEDRVIRCRFD